MWSLINSYILFVKKLITFDINNNVANLCTNLIHKSYTMLPIGTLTLWWSTLSLFSGIRIVPFPQRSGTGNAVPLVRCEWGAGEDVELLSYFYRARWIFRAVNNHGGLYGCGALLDKNLGYPACLRWTPRLRSRRDNL